MTEKNFEVLSALELALRTEKEGLKFYQEAKEKVKNRLARATFEALANEELKHIEIISEFYSSMQEKGEGIPLEDLAGKITKAAGQVKSVFEKAREHFEETIGEEMDVFSAYQKANRIEQEAYNLYDRLLKETKDEKAKQLYKFLYDLEWEHARLLQSTFEYLNNPAEWFLREERALLD